MSNDHLLDQHPRRKPGVLAGLRASFLTGLVVILPIGLTIWLLWTAIGWIDGVVLPFLPPAYHPATFMEYWFGIDAPLDVRGIGVVVFLVFTITVGWLAKGFIGRSLIGWAEGLVDRTPIVRSVYSGVKQIAETVFNQQDTSFDRACLVQYPREGIWAIAFISTDAKGEIKEGIPREDNLVSVFLPTTPNPTSGFLLFVPEADVRVLDMSVEDAAKLIISAGLVYPAEKDEEQPVPVQRSSRRRARARMRMMNRTKKEKMEDA